MKSFLQVGDFLRLVGSGVRRGLVRDDGSEPVSASAYYREFDCDGWRPSILLGY